MSGTVIKYGIEALQPVGGRPGRTSAPAAEVPLDVLGARICGLASRLAVATYQWLTMIGEFDARGGWTGVGIKSCAHWLAWTCSLAPGTAREHVRVARALVGLPLISTEMAAGRLSYAKVREITRIADRVDEAHLVTLARTATASQLARAVRGYRRAAGDRGRQEQTRTTTWFTTEDGSVVFSAHLPAEEGAILIAALEAARDQLHDIGPAGTTPPDRADMLLHLARGYLATAPDDRSGEDRTTVVVHVSAEHLSADLPDAERSRGNAAATAIPADCCQIPSVGGIEPETARRLACDATLIGVIRGTGGAILGHGRRRRLVSPAQRRALTIRDGHCQFPGCQRASHLEAHHVTPWSRGGTTDLNNLVLLCRFHHIACHEGGAVVTPAADSTPRCARWQFRTPDGEPYLGDRLDTLTSTGIRAWRDDTSILWNDLTRIDCSNHPEAQAIRPLWRGEPVATADTVQVLFQQRRKAA